MEMADQTYTATQVLTAAASSLIGGGIVAKIIEKLFSRSKEKEEVRLLAAQVSKTEAETPRADLQTLEMVLKALDTMQKTSSEREATAIERDKHAETREGLLRAHIVELEGKLEELSDKLEAEKAERTKLQNMLSKACFSCDHWKHMRQAV